MEHKKRKEARENLESEVQYLKRLQQEMETERIVVMEKKRQEKQYFTKMIEENQKNLDLQKVNKEKERLEDVRAQEAYARMLDQQEQDRLNEIQARENRAQAFMNRMADGVLKELDNIQKKEDEMISKYERQREMKLRREEELKAKKAEKLKQQIILTLQEQEADKKKREQELKTDMNKQADMWKRERDIWQDEDKRIQAKIKQINAETQQFLK